MVMCKHMTRICQVL